MKTKLFTLLTIAALLAGCGNAQQDEKTALAPKEFSQKMEETKNPVLIDVRTPEEFAEAHLDKSVNIDWNGDNFNEKVAGYNKEEPVFVYCRSGRRSGEAAASMRKNGFKHVFELKGGIVQWTEDSMPANK